MDVLVRYDFISGTFIFGEQTNVIQKLLAVSLSLTIFFQEVHILSFFKIMTEILVLITIIIIIIIIIVIIILKLK